MKWETIQIFTHQFNPGSQSFQYPMSLFCLFLVKEHKKKCISRPPASLSSPRQQANALAWWLDGRTERWTCRLLLELLTQAGSKAPCLSSSSLLPRTEKKYTHKKKRLLNSPEEWGWEKEQAGEKPKQVGGNTRSGRVRIKKERKDKGLKGFSVNFKKCHLWKSKISQAALQQSDANRKKATFESLWSLWLMLILPTGPARQKSMASKKQLQAWLYTTAPYSYI